MKVTLAPDKKSITIIGNFDYQGAPTEQARKIANGETDSKGKPLTGDAEGLNHGSTGFPIDTGFTFDDANGVKRALYAGINLTSHPITVKTAKPKF